MKKIGNEEVKILDINSANGNTTDDKQVHEMIQHAINIVEVKHTTLMTSFINYDSLDLGGDGRNSVKC